MPTVCVLSRDDNNKIYIYIYQILSENFQFLNLKFSTYLNMHVFFFCVTL